jgi:hypothetical protein
MKCGYRARAGRALLGFVSAALLSMGVARAQDAKPADGWTFQVTPYLWLAGFGGDITGERGNTASFSAGIGDVLSHLDGGLMLLGEARHGRFGILADFDYANLSAESGHFGPLLGQPSATMKEYLGTLEGAYRFVDAPGFKLDGLGGVRVMSLNTELSFSGALLPPRSDSAGDTWADPLLGLRVILPIAGGFFANAYGDVGGGPNSDLTGQLYGGFGYNFNETFTAYVGYRYLTMHHATERLDFDIAQQGPLIGVGIRF